MSDRNATIGFIGMGMMGGGMAANLLKAGFDMAAYDIDPAKNERFAGLGAKIANGPAGVAQAASTVICIVETTAQVREVVLGDGGVVEGAQEGDIFVCSATVNPLAVKELHDILAEKGIRMLDAPVSGGVPRAVSGDLSIIVGGDGDGRRLPPLFRGDVLQRLPHGRNRPRPRHEALQQHDHPGD